MNNCCCLDFDYESPEMHSQRLRRARKPHICCECHETIPAGALYEFVWGKWDGQFNTYKTCARCANIRDEYFTCGFGYGCLVSDFRECFDFDYRDGIPADFAPCRGKPAALTQ